MDDNNNNDHNENILPASAFQDDDLTLEQIIGEIYHVLI